MKKPISPFFAQYIFLVSPSTNEMLFEECLLCFLMIFYLKYNIIYFFYQVKELFNHLRNNLLHPIFLAFQVSFNSQLNLTHYNGVNDFSKAFKSSKYLIAHQYFFLLDVNKRNYSPLSSLHQ